MKKTIPSVVIGAYRVTRRRDGVLLSPLDSGRRWEFRGGYKAAARGIAHRGIVELEVAYKLLAPLYPAGEVVAPVRSRGCATCKPTRR